MPHQRRTYICVVDVPPILQCPVSLLRAQPIVGVGRCAYHFPGLPARSLAPIGCSRRNRVLPGCRCIIMYSWAWTGVLRVLFVWVVFLLLHIHSLLETVVISSFSLASSVPSPSLSKVSSEPYTLTLNPPLYLMTKQGAFHFLNDQARHTTSVRIIRKRIYRECKQRQQNDRTRVLGYDKTHASPRLNKKPLNTHVCKKQYGAGSGYQAAIAIWLQAKSPSRIVGD